MTLTKHISGTCKSAYMHIRKIRSIRKFLTDKAVKTLRQSVVISRLDYCNNVYVGLPMKSIHKMDISFICYKRKQFESLVIVITLHIQNQYANDYIC